MLTIIAQDIILRNQKPETALTFSANENWREFLDEVETQSDGPILIHCSLAIAQWIQNHRKGTKLAAGISLPDGLEAHKQMGRMGSMMLNDTGVFLPFSQLEKNWATLQSLYGDNLFCRPNSPYKPFSGRPINAHDWKLELASLTQIDRVAPDELCFIGPTKTFEQPEWRYWMVDGEIAGKAPYSFDGPTLGETSPQMDSLAKQGAQALIDLDMLMVIDCVHTPNGPKIMEANGFSTSGFYPEANLPKIWEKTASYFGI